MTRREREREKGSETVSSPSCQYFIFSFTRVRFSLSPSFYSLLSPLHDKRHVAVGGAPSLQGSYHSLPPLAVCTKDHHFSRGRGDP